MKWYKASNDFSSDTKLRLITKKTGVKHCETLQVLHVLLERCSKNNSENYGQNSHLKEELSLHLDIDLSSISLILESLKSFEIIDDHKVLNWAECQGSSSVERVRKWREKQKKDVTKCNVTETLRNVTKQNVTFEKREEEKRREYKKDISDDISKKKNFQKPKIEEIKNYCLERNNSVDAETFFDFYESKGWKIGKEAMKDWKAAVRTWERGRGSYRSSNNQSDEYMEVLQSVVSRGI